MSATKPIPTAPGLVLRIKGTDFGGWLSMRIRRDVEAAASTFECEVSERWPGRAQPWRITPGDPVEVLLDGELVLTGFVDAFSPSFDSRSHRVEVRGTSKTQDFFQSSADVDGGQFKGVNLKELAGRLAKPYGLSVDFRGPEGEARDVQLQQGESGYETVERLSRVQGVLVRDTPQGSLLFDRPGKNRAASALVQGKNILAARAELDWSDRFSTYTFKGQKQPADNPDEWPKADPPGNGRSARRGARVDLGDIDGGGDDVEAGGPGDTAVSVSGSATDKAVRRYRPLIVYGDNAMTEADAAQRALYEMRRRVGKSQKAEVTVQGWHQTPGGPLWHEGDMVAITAPWLGVDKELCIAAVEFSMDDNGRRTTLSLTLVDAFLPSADDLRAANKPASGADQDTKANFWKSAGQASDAVGPFASGYRFPGS